MNDILPFPNTTGITPEEKITNISNYLIQLKEELEFILTNISADNLSPTLIDKLNSLGSDLEKRTEEADDKISQVAGKKGITLYDVFNSETFKELKNSVEEQEDNLTASDDLVFKFGKNGDGSYGYYGADGSLIPFKKTYLYKNIDVTFGSYAQTASYTKSVTVGKRYMLLINLFTPSGGWTSSSYTTTGANDVRRFYYTQKGPLSTSYGSSYSSMNFLEFTASKSSFTVKQTVSSSVSYVTFALFEI